MNQTRPGFDPIYDEPPETRYADPCGCILAYTFTFLIILITFLV